MTNQTAPDYLNQEFIITREFDAPRKLVWKACTEASHLARWWGPRGFTTPVCEWDARPGNKIYVVMRAPNGMDYPMGGKFHEVVPPERLVTTSGALDENGQFLFEIRHIMTLVERKGKTTLTMHSRVIKTTPGAGRYIGGFEAGMTQSLVRLGEILKSGSEPVVIERTFKAPVARVWQALTDVNQIRRWYFDLKEFKPETGFKFQFTVQHKGTTYCHLCKITSLIPQKRIAYTWRYKGQPGNSLVTFDLVADGDQTKLKLTHEGLETFPKTPAYARKNFMGGWTYITSAFDDYLQNVDREIHITREVQAPQELVWKAMTDPEHMVNWWGPNGLKTTMEKMDVRPGGTWKYVMHGPDGADYPNKSIFKEVVKPERLVFKHGGSRKGGPGANFVGTWTFEKVAAKKTKVTIHMVFPTMAARDVVVKEYGAIEGGKQTLERLDNYLAKM